MSKTDWAAIKADYLATGLPYTELSKKWGVSLSTLKKRGMREKWGQTASQVALEAAKEEALAMEPTVPQKTEPDEELELPAEPEPQDSPWRAEISDPKALALEMRVARRAKLLTTTDAMMDRIITALDLIDPDNTYAISMLVRALKDLRDLQGLSKDQLDLEEQQARIAKLRSETRDQESESAGGVLLIPAIDEELQPPEEEKQ